jgi:hypothetical protein
MIYDFSSLWLAGAFVAGAAICGAAWIMDRANYMR